MAASPKPCITRPVITKPNVLQNWMLIDLINIRFFFGFHFDVLIFLHWTYVSSGKNDTGPTRENAVAINMLPITAASFGCKNLSIIHPHMGAVVAYNPPWMMKIAPSKTGLKSNCLKCGSSVAAKNPIDALAAIIVIEQTIIAGILSSDNIETTKGKLKMLNRFDYEIQITVLSNCLPPECSCCIGSLCFGRMQNVMRAVTNSNVPKVPNGKKYPPNWYRKPPTIGPAIRPSPKNVSSDANVTLTLSGNSFAINANDAVKNAALPIASIIRMINANVKNEPCPCLWVKFTNRQSKKWTSDL